MERCGGDRGKGFFWSLDEEHIQSLEDQEAKNSLALQNTGGKEGKAKRKDKGAPLSEPPLKRSIKGDTKGIPLPPPLTTTPLVPKHLKEATTTTSSTPSTTLTTSTTKTPAAAPAATGVFAYNSHPHHSVAIPPTPSVTPATGHIGPALSVPNPYAVLTQAPWGLNRSAAPVSATSTAPGTSAFNSTPPVTSASQLAAPTPATTGLEAPAVPDVVVPLVLGPVPPSHPEFGTAREGYMILHERKLILDPDIFSSLTTDMLAELEKMGASKALVLLTGHMVRVLKERRALERKSGKGRKKAARAKAGNPSSTKGGLDGSTAAPLPDAGSDQLHNAVPAAASKPPAPTTDASSPFVIVDDSEDDGPAPKKRKVDGAVMSSAVALS